MKSERELEAEIDRLGQALQQHRTYVEGFAQVVGVLSVHYPNWRGRADTSIIGDAVKAVEYLATRHKRDLEAARD